jgi:hypothetical protein
VEDRNRAANSMITLDPTTLKMLDAIASPKGVRPGW